jgi:hypothetical protein
MIENITLPEEMLISIGSETKEFAVLSRHKKPVSQSLGRIFFGLFWLGFISIFVVLMVGPLFTAGEVTMQVNGVDQTASWSNLKPMLIPFIFLGVFVGVGFFLLIPGIVGLFRKGGYFAGTPTRLVWYKKGNLKSMDWEQFTGVITVRGSNTKGNITLEMRTGNIVSGKGGSRYVPDVVYMLGIPGAYDIEQILRKRIKENDPTKSSS